MIFVLLVIDSQWMAKPVQALVSNNRVMSIPPCHLSLLKPYFHQEKLQSEHKLSNRINTSKWNSSTKLSQKNQNYKKNQEVSNIHNNNTSKVGRRFTIIFIKYFLLEEHEMEKFDYKCSIKI